MNGFNQGLADCNKGNSGSGTSVSSIPGNFGRGYDDGKQAALNTYNNGGTFDASCPVNFLNNISYCTAYHAGYNWQWGNLKGQTYNQGGP